MSNAAMLRERAANCREMAKEYHPSVGAPLLEKAIELDREAAELERNGRERRREEGAFFGGPPAGGGAPFAGGRPPVRFGKRRIWGGIPPANDGAAPLPGRPALIARPCRRR